MIGVQDDDVGGSHCTDYGGGDGHDDDGHGVDARVVGCISDDVVAEGAVGGHNDYTSVDRRRY